MKKTLLSIGLLAATFTNAQENWINVESSGFYPVGATFRVNHIFQNKIYVAGDTAYQSPMVGSLLFSSSTGDAGTFAKETGLNAVLLAGTVASAASNSSYLFLGSEVKYDTTGGVAGKTPQIYRFDGTTYTQHGTIDYSTLPPDNQIPSGNTVAIPVMALYSPTGSNDTIYAFEQTTSGIIQKVSVFKAPANVTNPTWINCANFSYGSGISKVYDAQVWHKKLYIAVNSSANGGMILRTSNGADWDTVVTGAALSSVLGVNSFNDYFTALQIYNDTLVAGVINSFNAALVYTADSLTVGQTWSALIDSAGSKIMTSSISNIVDMAVGDGKLWIQANASGYPSPLGFVVTKNAGNKDTLLSSSASTGLESGFNYGPDYRMSYFHNAVYAVGHSSPGGRIGNPNGKHSSNSGPAGTPMNAGNIWRFKTVNPVASFVDSVNTGTGYCQGNSIYLACTSANAATAEWYSNGSHFASGLNVTYNPNVGGVDVIKMIVYNGTNQSLYKDSTSNTITIYWNPVIDTVTASSYTVCQGQPDTLKTKVHSGTAPYTYTWHNIQDNLTYPGDSTTVIQLYVVPTPSPYVMNYVMVKDAKMCVGSGPNTMLYIYVNKGDSLSGTISDTLLNAVGHGQVYLFQKKANHVGLADSSGVFSLDSTGHFYFPSLYYGDYFLKAVADTAYAAYKTSVGTYYSTKVNAYQWDSALVIQQHSCTGGNNSGKDITVIQIPNAPTGPGTITGRVSKADGFGSRHNGLNSVMGAPLKGVDIKLGKNPGGGAAARTTSDTSGNYTFTNVPIGKYKIYVDIPNYGMDSVRGVDLTVNNVSVHNDYYVDSTMIRIVQPNMVVAAICAGDSVMLQGAYQHSGGIFYDTLTATAGYDSLIITNLSITALPTVSVTASTFTVCSGSNVTLTANGTTSYTWSSNAGSVATSTASINPTATDVYTVTGTTNGCTDTETVSIAVNQLPTPTISSNSPVCVNQTFSLTSGGGATYSWSGPNSYTSSTQNPSVTGVTTAATGIYTVAVTDANTCVNTATVSVVVNPLPVVIPIGATVCENNTINLGTNSGGTGYSWSGPMSYVSNQQNPSITNATPNMSGNYAVTVTDANGCVNGGIAQVAVNALPVVSASGSTVCVGANIGMGSSNGGVTYSWSGPNAYSSGTQNPTINNAGLSMNGDYTVTVTDANNCVNTNTAQVVVNSLPAVTAVATATSVCYGNPVTLSGSGASSYTWSGGVQDGVGFVPTITDTYTVVGVDANMCSNTATVSVVVTCIGINQYGTAGSLNVYPIPASNSLIIEVEKNATVKIYDIAGQTMLEQSVNAGKNEINTTNLPSGAYDLMVNSEGKTTYVKVMISK